VLHLAGHSLGHVGLHEPTTGTAIVSDAVIASRFTRADGSRAGPPPYVDVQAYRSTIATLRELVPARLCTAHFPVLEGADVARFLDRSERFVDELERALERAMVRGDESVAELLGPVAGQLGGYPEMEVELARSIVAHLEK
jgi:glyoxylase-like metal-dependent hydrolase (beta-lactamase superfamily II)